LESGSNFEAPTSEWITEIGLALGSCLMYPYFSNALALYPTLKMLVQIYFKFVTTIKVGQKRRIREGNPTLLISSSMGNLSYWNLAQQIERMRVSFTYNKIQAVFHLQGRMKNQLWNIVGLGM
jgi:hypothetical protein